MGKYSMYTGLLIYLQALCFTLPRCAFK